MNNQSIAQYLPHLSPMIFLDKIDLIEQTYIICNVTVSNHGVLAPFLDEDGELASYYFIEMMAQTIGVWNGYHARASQEKPKIAFLLGSRSFHTQVPTVPLGTHLKIVANLILRDDNLANFETDIIIDQKKIASAKLNVYQPTQAETQTILQERSRMS